MTEQNGNIDPSLTVPLSSWLWAGVYAIGWGALWGWIGFTVCNGGVCG